MATPPTFAGHVYKGKQQKWIAFAFLVGENFFPRGITLKGKNLLSTESKFFTLRVIRYEKGNKYCHDKLIPFSDTSKYRNEAKGD